MVIFKDSCFIFHYQQAINERCVSSVRKIIFEKRDRDSEQPHRENVKRFVRIVVFHSESC